MTRRTSVVALVVIFGTILLSAASAGAHERSTPVAVSAALGTHAIAESLTEVLVAPRRDHASRLDISWPWHSWHSPSPWRPRRVVALGLIAIMAVLACEIGVHTAPISGSPKTQLTVVSRRRPRSSPPITIMWAKLRALAEDARLVTAAS
jgi:hypothetical protein